jgi:undecaprenyl-phosphate galactose phosphotransferase
MRELVSKLIFLITDSVAIFISIFTAYHIRYSFGLIPAESVRDISDYLTLYPVYIVTFIIFAYEGIYSRRYDLWHESRIVIKSLILSFVISMAYLAITKTAQEYSRLVITLSYISMIVVIPLFKRTVKYILYHSGLWQKKAKIYGEDRFLREEIFGNFYLGYVDSGGEGAQTVFISSRGMDKDELSETIDAELRRNREVIFIPLLDDFDFTHSQIYELSNVRTNLVSLQNRLKSGYRRAVKYLFDYGVALISLPLLLPLVVFIAWLVKREEPDAPIFFIQPRLGTNDTVFPCFKFRTMKMDGDEILRRYLEENPEEVEYYERYHKYRDDPRVTGVGAFLRRTSLDEIPQIYNVLRGEMSLVGPRPYMTDEIPEDTGGRDIILSVRPGITGLWQVSGRSDVDFSERMRMDIWYIRNWNLWMDIVILAKTVKILFSTAGAR